LSTIVGRVGRNRGSDQLSDFFLPPTSNGRARERGCNPVDVPENGSEFCRIARAIDDVKHLLDITPDVFPRYFRAPIKNFIGFSQPLATEPIGLHPRKREPSGDPRKSGHLADLMLFANGAVHAIERELILGLISAETPRCIETGAWRIPARVHRRDPNAICPLILGVPRTIATTSVLTRYRPRGERSQDRISLFRDPASRSRFTNTPRISGPKKAARLVLDFCQFGSSFSNRFSQLCASATYPKIAQAIT